MIYSVNARLCLLNRPYYLASRYVVSGYTELCVTSGVPCTSLETALILGNAKTGG